MYSREGYGGLTKPNSTSRSSAGNPVTLDRGGSAIFREFRFVLYRQQIMSKFRVSDPRMLSDEILTCSSAAIATPAGTSRAVPLPNSC